MSITAGELAERIGGTVEGDAASIIETASTLECAGDTSITFAENAPFFEKANASAAGVILTPRGLGSSSKTLIHVDNARAGWAKALTILHPEPATIPGVHPSAVISESATVDPTAQIGPNCVIEDHVRIGARTRLQATVFVGANSVIGEDVRIHANVTLYHGSEIGNRVEIHGGATIGADGFGYAFENGTHLKIPQIGFVRIEDDVEIGANTCVDRAALGVTLIKRGAKIDNLVQVGHNCQVGEHAILCGQVGFAGSTIVEDYAVLAGQVGVAGHLRIGRGAKIGAQSGVMHDVPDGDSWLGSPAMPDKETKRIMIALRGLPDLRRQLKRLESKLASE